jgi:hypothetical protein
VSLDESYISNREAVERGAAADAARAKADWEEQKLLESDEAELSRWRTLFRRMAEERGEVVYRDATPDRRLFAVEGDLIEQARRDRERHGFPGDAA